MIGDWVRVPHIKKIGKVYRIDRANGKGNGFAAVIDGDFHESLLEPIPLKRVHLTKNGFKATDPDDTTFVLKDGYEVEVTFDRGIEEMEIPPTIYLSIKFADAEYWKTIDYVHQLQHAMRMFDIEKEISL